MANRKNVLIHQIASAQSLSSSFTSIPTTIRYLDNCSYQINITTTDSTGSFAVQGSNDYYVDEPTNTVTNPGTWLDLPLSGGTPTVAAANDSILIDMNQVPFSALRLRYIPTIAGTGTVNIFITFKSLGA